MSYGHRKHGKFLDCDVNVPNNPRVVRPFEFYSKSFMLSCLNARKS